MRTKIIKEYSNRQRINLTKEDNMVTGGKVYIFTEAEYHQQEQYISDLQSQLTTVKNECEIYKNRAETFSEVIEDSKSKEIQLKEIIQDSLTPIDTHYKEEIRKKEDHIKQLTDELNKLKKICNQFSIKINQLSTIDIWIRKKHNQIINDFTNSIWIISQDDNTINDADVPAIPGDNESQEKEI